MNGRDGFATRLPRHRFGIAALAALCFAMLLPACGGGSQSEEPPNTAPMATAAPEEGGGSGEQSATLDVMSGQPTEIKLDGKPIGKTPISGYKIPPGTHDVTFVFSDKDTPTLSVTLGPGEAQTVKLDPPPQIREGAKPAEKK
jgi:hypothetical protein